MLKQDLLMRNPLRLLGQDTEKILSKGGFGAVLARAGVGKTSLMVQLALNFLLNHRNVLHISLNDPVNKVSLWYEEVFRRITDAYSPSQITQLWETILTHRFIMTFQVEGFTVPKLEERLTDLDEQGIFFPCAILIDGLPFGESAHDILNDLKEMTYRYNIQAWFSVRTHRHESPDPSGIAPQLSRFVDLFQAVIELRPQGKQVHVLALKGGIHQDDSQPVLLDPATMLIHTAD